MQRSVSEKSLALRARAGCAAARAARRSTACGVSGGSRPSAGLLDQRRAALEVPAGHPVLAIGAGHESLARTVVVEQREVERVAEHRVRFRAEDLRGPRLHCRHLLLGEQRLVGELARPLERRGAVVLPGALQIGLAVRQARQGPRRLGDRVTAAEPGRESNDEQRSTHERGLYAGCPPKRRVRPTSGSRVRSFAPKR